LWLVPRQIRLTGGVRVAGIDNKSSAGGGTIVSQSASNTFVGAGPRIAMESLYPIMNTRWTLFTRADAAGTDWYDRQTFNQTAGGLSASGTDSSTVVLFLSWESRAGVHWLPEWGCGAVKFSGGYQWERWSHLGTSNSSFNELTVQGPFYGVKLHSKATTTNCRSPAMIATAVKQADGLTGWNQNEAYPRQ